MNYKSAQLSLLLLAVLSISLASVFSTISFVSASTTENESGDESSDEANTEESTDEESEPEPEPEPPAVTEPEPEPEPESPPSVVVDEPPTPTLPICDGTPQDCVTENGDICLEGQGGHECECAEDMSDCPNHPSLLEPPVEEPTCPPGQFPVTPGDPSSCVDCEGPCPETPPPEEPPTEGPDEDCLFDPSLPKCKSDNGVCPEGFFQNEDGNCVPRHPNGCPEGYHSHENDETGRCIPDDVPCEPGYIRDPDFPTCSDKEFVCREHPTIDECKDDEDEDEEHEHREITIIINKIIKETNSGNHHDGFPDVDIIGLSVKENGEAMICAIDIDDERVQCQEFGMEDNRVNGDFWRIIETDHDKDYDNGNTGSNDIDGVIDDIKSQDFSELEDKSNHDFNIDLAWIAINPQGDGVTCLLEDQSGKGKSLCEPFKVSAADISGQITEGVEFG